MYRINPDPWGNSFQEPLSKRLRRLCRSNLTPQEISDILQVPTSWVYDTCEIERQGLGWQRNPVSDRIIYPYQTRVKFICDTCGESIYPGETCEAVCMETETGSLLAPHEVKCEHCVLVGRRYNPW